ncbi:MAG: hypothetical protein EA397_06710 [Deltaproteobacteria bacterium]|nr:MAG: hypothetical protein EA397_06710 [Deltaproteobacteria bacterium]
MDVLEAPHEVSQDQTAHQLGIASIILGVVGWVVMCGCGILGLSLFAYGFWMLGLILSVVGLSARPSEDARPMLIAGSAFNILSMVLPCLLAFIAVGLYILMVFFLVALAAIA